MWQKLICLAILFLNSINALDYTQAYYNHPCKRSCGDSETRICQYEFIIEEMIANTPDCKNCLKGTPSDCFKQNCIVIDGTNSSVIVYNRYLPGPTIEVCEGDEIIVHLTSLLAESTTSMHFHGLQQRGTQWMDGVPFVTQCPILPSAEFQYKVKASQVGIHSYYSLVGTQKANGAYGALIVRPAVDPHKSLYNYDLSPHTLVISDWTSKYSLNTHILRDFFLLTGMNNITSAILINGRGRNPTNSVPMEKFFVKPGFRYRFRIIHAGAQACPMKFRIANHEKLLIIAVDGNSIQPVAVDEIYIENGERIDFVLAAHQQPGQFLIEITGLFMCANTYGFAVLHYENVANQNIVLRPLGNSNPKALALNCLNYKYTKNCINYDQLTGLYLMHPRLPGKPDFKYYLGFGYINYTSPRFISSSGFGNKEHITVHINRISFEVPKTPLIYGMNAQMVCNYENKLCNQDVCECTHVIPIPTNSLVELILVHEGNIMENASHPMHLHGYGFNVLGMGMVGTTNTMNVVRNLDQAGKVKRNFVNPPVKDTLGVPAGGYAVIRFLADNDGPWMLHSNVVMDMMEGMSVVLKIGNLVLNDIPRC